MNTNTNTVVRSEQIYLKSLNANDRFLVPGTTGIFVCESRVSNDTMSMVTYRELGTDYRMNFVRSNRSTVYLLTD
jgi:hypothetical protein